VSGPSVNSIEAVEERLDDSHKGRWLGGVSSKRLVTHVSIGRGRGGSGQSGTGVWRKEASRVGWERSACSQPSMYLLGWGTSRPVSSGEDHDLV
jgi:hypothetical protein